MDFDINILDEAEFGEVDFEDLDFEVDPLDYMDVDDTEANILSQVDDIFAPIVQTYVTEEFNLKYHSVPRIPKGKREYKELPNYPLIGPKGKMVGKGDKVYYISEGKSVVVGKSMQNSEYKFDIDMSNCFIKADIYCEEVRGRGSGLSFSSFVHLAACWAMAIDGVTIIEPIEGNDLTYTSETNRLNTTLRGTPLEKESLRVEITGLNYNKRYTNTQWVINKYALLMSGLGMNDFILLSRKEETLDTVLCDITPSEYTQELDRIRSAIRLITDEQKEGLQNFSLQYYKQYEYKFSIDEDINPTKVIDQCFVNGSKLNFDGMPKYSCPYRALPVRRTDNINPMHEVQCLLYDDYSNAKQAYEDMRSTYHVLDKNDEIFELCTETTNLQLPDDHIIDSLHAHVRKSLLKYEVFQNLRLQNDLFPRITMSNKPGFYFSTYHNVGIAWNRVNRNSFTTRAIFYTFSPPGDVKKVGNWAFDGTIYRSPTFLISKDDVNYAQCLYARAMTTYITLLNMNGHKKYVNIDKELCLYFSVCNNSTYLTSEILGNMRFVTTGHVSGNDRTNLIVRGLMIDKPMRFCDYLSLKLIERYVIEPKDHSTTPLFKFPLKFLSLEKDIGNTLMWKNRIADHDTKCVEKFLLKTAQEKDYRPKVVEWYKKQADFLELMLQEGVSYKQFAKLLDECPDKPAMCIPFYIGLCNVLKDELKIASSTQTNTGFCINVLATDHGSIHLKNGDKFNIIATKVATELAKYINEQDVKLPYHIMCKIMFKDFPHVFLLRSKNGRGRREYATQHIESRIAQAYGEYCSSTVSLALPDDQFLSPHKYNDMVYEFTKILSRKMPSEASSEDRSYHCGNYQPEAVSAACLCISAIVGSNPMSSQAALMRRYTHRYAIMPPLYDGTLHLNTDHDFAYLTAQGKTVKLPAVKTEYNGMQGMWAVTLGVINTIQAKGLMKFAEMSTECIVNSYVITTQDDAGRAVNYKPGTDIVKASNFVFEKPMGLLKLTSQEANLKKHVSVKRVGVVEVNNIAITSSGMVSQEPIHSSLVIQPLNGETPIEDLNNVVSNARSTIFWGDSPVLAWAALEYGLKIFQNKWRITNAHMRMFRDIGLIPNKTNEIIEGFYPRTEYAMGCIIKLENEESIKEIKIGTRSLLHTLRLKNRNKENDKDYELPMTGMFTLDYKLKMIVRSRQMGGHLKVFNNRGLSLKVIKERREKLIEIFTQDKVPPDILSEFIKPCKIKSIIRPMVASDKKPTIMGVRSQVVNNDFKNIFCSRLLKANYRDLLEDEDYHISKLSDDKFLEQYGAYLQKEKYKGFIVYSPSGLPRVSFMETTKYTHPHCFDFNISLEPTKFRKNAFLYQGVEVYNVKPCLFGGAMLSMKGIFAFAVGTVGQHRYAFYKKVNHQIKAIDITSVGDVPYKVFDFAWGNVIVLLKEDWSPIKADHHRTVPGLYGDEVATLNYGGYLRSNSQGFEILQDHVKDRFIIPSWMKQYYPKYPRFKDGYTTITGDNIYLAGYKYISLFKHVLGIGNGTIDLNHSEIKFLHMQEAMF